MISLKFQLVVAFILLGISSCKNSQVQSAEARFPFNDMISSGYFITGNEPYWNATVNVDSSILSFEGLSDEIPRFELPLIKVEENRETGEWLFIGKSNDKNIQIGIIESECNDGMSDNVYAFSSQVSVNPGSGQTLNFTGCGSKMGSSKLKGSWKLESISGKNVSEFENSKIPELNLDPGMQSAFGFSGCNRFSGKLYSTESTIRFGPIAGTKMACMDMELESAFLSFLSDGNIGYQFEDNKLVLTSDKGVLIFVK